MIAPVPFCPRNYLKSKQVPYLPHLDQVHIVATPSTTNTQEVSYEYSYEDPLNRIPRIAIGTFSIDVGINHFET